MDVLRIVSLSAMSLVTRKEHISFDKRMAPKQHGLVEELSSLYPKTFPWKHTPCMLSLEEPMNRSKT